MKSSQSKIRNLVSVSITLLIVLMLVFSGPASAVKIEMSAPSGDYYTGDTVTFTVDVIFQTNDLIPIESINVTALPKGDLTFSPDGTIINGSADYTVTRKTYTADYREGYGYGYDFGYGYGYDFGYGYGYGYDPSVTGPSKLTYEIKISGLSVDVYKDTASIKVMTGDSNKPAFSANQNYEFNIIPQPSSKKRGGAGVSRTQTQKLVNGIATFSGEVGRFISSIKISGATGSTKVGLSSSNPTTVNINKHVFQYISIDAGENSGREGTITFKINTASLTSAGIAHNNVAMYRFSNNKWNELPTQWLKTAGSYEEYSVELPGFSYFAIAEKGAESVEPPTAVTTKTPVPTTGEPGEVSETETTAIPTATKKKGIPGFEAVMFTSGLLTVAYILRRKRG
jgi:PGF-pre-PGF domain-containing protein